MESKQRRPKRAILGFEPRTRATAEILDSDSAPKPECWPKESRSPRVQQSSKRRRLDSLELISTFFAIHSIAGRVVPAMPSRCQRSGAAGEQGQVPLRYQPMIGGKPNTSRSRGITSATASHNKIEKTPNRTAVGRSLIGLGVVCLSAEMVSISVQRAGRRSIR
jgi:hypothetical protein